MVNITLLSDPSSSEGVWLAILITLGGGGVGDIVHIIIYRCINAPINANPHPPPPGIGWGFDTGELQTHLSRGVVSVQMHYRRNWIISAYSTISVSLF